MTSYGEQVRDAAAKIARNYRRDHPDRVCCMGRNENIARKIEAMPLPEAPKDERAEMFDLVRGIFGRVQTPITYDALSTAITDALRSAGWRRSP